MPKQYHCDKEIQQGLQQAIRVAPYTQCYITKTIMD